MNFKPFLFGAASVLAGAAASPVYAQTGEAQQAPRAGGLEEVVVTAQRREERVQDIPIAVTAFTAMELEAAQIKDTKDLVRFTPSLTGGLNTGTGGAVSYYMRGLGSTEQIATFDVPVATYLDEIYIARQSVSNISLFDVERTEVLRGPQGTLFGRNTTGGAISIVTRKPGEEFGGFVEASAGSFERYQVRGSVDLPINSTVLTKLSGFYIDDSGYSTSQQTGQKLNGEEGYGVRGAVRLLPSDNLTWDLSVDYVNQDKTTVGVFPQDRKEYKPRTGLRIGDCEGGIIDEFVNSLVGNCSNIETGGVTSNVKYDFDFATLNFITGYRTTTQNFALDFGVVAPGTQATGAFVLANEIANQQFSQEIKLTGEAGAIRWVAGLFYLDEQNKTEQLQTFGLFGGLVDGHWKMKNSTETFAVYAQGDFEFYPDWTLTLGGRWTTEEKEIAYQDATRALSGYPRLGLVSTGSATLVNAKTRPTSANLTARGVPLSQGEEKFTPRIALTHKVTDDVLVYASITNGFKSGGWEARQTDARLINTFGPETAWSYEAGVKSEWFDKRLRANVTVYHQDVDDIQLISGFPLAGGGINFITQNNGELRASGIEVELLARPTKALDLFATLSGADRKYVNVPARNGAGGVPCATLPEPASCITTNDEPVRFPEVQGTLGGRYTIPLTGLQSSLSFSASASLSGHYWTSTANDTPFAAGTPLLSTNPNVFGATPVAVPLSKVGPTQIINVGMAYKTDNGRWEAALECSNCSEEYYFTSSLVGVGYENDPRRVTGRIKFNF